MNTACENYRDLPRRQFFFTGGLGLFGLTMPALFRARAVQAAAAGTPVAPKAKADHMIVIWLGGGPPHQDMFDMKPDAPTEIRGPLNPVKTNVSGIDICELMP
ncbi:MAG: DUF1501 domain-containing protein, partial [Phycisphaeraceae bacterium]